MSTRVITSVAVAGVLVLASCMQDNSPSALAPTEASRLTAPGTCVRTTFSVIENDAKAYFSSTTDPVFAKITAMGSAWKSGGTTGATAPGFAILRQVGIAIGTTRVKGDATQGNKLVNDVFTCMSVSGYTYPMSFAPALDVDGLFSVRNGAAADAQFAVVSRGTEGTPALPTTIPKYGAEKEIASSPWHATAGEMLFYGRLVPTSVVTGEANAGYAFELSTLPSGLDFSANQIKAGVCTIAAGGKILHDHDGVAGNGPAAILPNPGTPAFCANPPAVLLTQRSTFGDAMRRVASLFSPQPLYAFGVGGSALVRDLSFLGAVTYTDSLEFVAPVPNANVSNHTTQYGTPGIQVRAFTRATHTPLIGVSIQLDVIGNKGSFIDHNKVQATVGPNGIATFTSYFIDKAGGYTITATSAETGKKVTSNLFNINGQ
jgi:hypothetical protein